MKIYYEDLFLGVESDLVCTSSNPHGPIHDCYKNLDISGIFAGLAFHLLCTKADMISENKLTLFIVSQ